MLNSDFLYYYYESPIGSHSEVSGRLKKSKIVINIVKTENTKTANIWDIVYLTFNAPFYLVGHIVAALSVSQSRIRFRAITLLFMVEFRYCLVQWICRAQRSQGDLSLLVIFQGASMGSTDILVTWCCNMCWYFG